MASSARHLKRRTAVFAALLSGGVLLLLGAVPWVTGSATIPGAGAENISSSGGQAAPVIPALGLVLLAAAVALALARRIGALVTATLIILSGATTTAVSAVVLNDPASAMSSQVTEVTAILLPPEAISGVTITIWVAVGAVFGVIIAVLGILIWRGAAKWQVDKRHEKSGAKRADSSGAASDDLADADLWDLLSDGQDPTT